VDEGIFRSGKLCVVGNINRDIKTAPLSASDSLFADGETSIDGIQETIGGGGANSAAIAARLGATVHFLAQTGGDALGRQLESAMAAAGVECFFHQDPATPTGTTVNLVWQTGQRHFLSCHPNNRALAFENINVGALDGMGHLLRADIWFSEPMLYGGNAELFDAAKGRGLAISLDLNWDPAWKVASLAEVLKRKEAVRQLLPMVDLAHGNIRELCEFTSEAELSNALQRIEEWGAGGVVVHMGSKGAGYYTKGHLEIVAPAPVKNALLATGTGDVLSACLILTHGQGNVRDRLQFANQIVAEYMSGMRKLIPSLGQ
jgi:sugar/nucleoside kinase (ribokinase family)